MTGITHRSIEANGIRMHVAEAGSGPAVLLCHGFPESWYSWRHQLAALAAAGYHAVAPDMRGYGDTESPREIERFTLLHLVGDMVGILDALQEPRAAIVGHDWGAPVAWHAALLRPDRFHAVAGLSVPYLPRGRTLPTAGMPRSDDAQFYQLYFQSPGRAETELETDVRDTLSRVLYSGSGDVQAHAGGDGAGMVPRNGGFLTRTLRPKRAPSWLTEEDLDTYVRQFQASGFRGGLNWYRNIDRNWELLAAFAGARIMVPALYIGGAHDPVLAFPRMREIVADLRRVVPSLRKSLLLEGCGHWTQQERPAEVNHALLDFLAGLQER